MQRSVATTLFAATCLFGAQPVSISTSASATFDDTGAYSVSIHSPEAAFAGTLAWNVLSLTRTSGADSAGAYDEIIATGIGRSAAIRVYAATGDVLFTDTYSDAAANASAHFPSFSTYPAMPYRLAYEGIFSLANFGRAGPGSPWIYFDDQRNTIVLSNASQFNVGQLSITNGNLTSVIDESLNGIPAGYSHRTLLVSGSGMGETMRAWGRALLALQGKDVPASDADAVLAQLGYWTDAGATYYYHYEDGRQYQGTLLAIRDEFVSKGVPLGYMQLDSWFYPKGPRQEWGDNADGIYEYVADSTLFPASLETFQSQLGLPLVTHARWIDASSPYRQEYQMSGNVILDPLFWRQTASYLRSSGVVAFEQDWLGAQAQPAAKLNDGNTFFTNMASAMQAAGIGIQYCMPLPRHLLQSTKHRNVRTVRMSEDRFGRSRWDEFVYGSQFASVLGLWPWVDVFMSNEIENLLIATLSAGPVGVGDRVGTVNRENLLRAVRADGVIVKPDAPLVPTDQTIAADARRAGAPMVAWTYTDFDGFRAAYVFSYTRTDDHNVRFLPREMGLSGPVYVWRYFAGTGTVADAGREFTDILQSDREYYLVVPIGASGVAFLGDAGNFAGWGKKRVSGVADDGALTATIHFAAGERKRTVWGYAARQPSVTVIGGRAGFQRFDPSTGIYRIDVAPGRDSTATVRLTANTGIANPRQPLPRH